MNLGFFAESKIKRGKFIAVMLLNLGALSWFFVFNNYMTYIFTTLTPNTPDWGSYIGNSLFYGSIIFWSTAISFIGRRINRRKLLFASTILGIFSTVLLALLEGTFFISILSFLMGTSLGLALPSSLALVADYSVVENRGRLSGMIILGTFIIGFIPMGIDRILNLDLFDIILLLVVLRSISIFALVIEKFDRLPTIGKKIRIRTYRYKDFLTYLFPWILFSIAANLAWNLIPKTAYLSEVNVGMTLRFVLIALFAVAAGFMADRIGRKLPIQIGYATLGIGFLLLGFDLTGISIIIYLVLSGITWGSFFVVFLAVPGDLSFPSSREKFYTLGYIFPLFGQFAISTIPTSTLTVILPPEQICIILGICLFLAIIQVSRAKETLAESKIQERKLKEHLERAHELQKKLKKNNKVEKDN